MKRKIVVIGGLILVVIGVIFYLSKNNDLVSESVPKNNLLTMMLETDVDSNKYEVASNNNWPQEGYSFNQELSYCEQGSTLLWNEESKSISLKTSVSDKCYIYFDKEPEIIYLADYIKNVVYTGVDGENGLYYHDGVGSYTNADQEAGDNSYRYSGADPANYVCFGSDAETCPNDNLYRIIGVFNGQIKLIKNASIGNMQWDNNAIVSFENTNSISVVSNNNNEVFRLNNILAAGAKCDGSNDWKTADLNYYINNDSFYNNLSAFWKELISESVWKIGGNTMEYLEESVVKTSYNYEVGLNSENITYNGKIGLMYVSDYGYAASPENWTTKLSNYNNITSTNWLYLGEEEYTITPENSSLNLVFSINGYVDRNGVCTEVFSLAVRPVFYLNSDVAYISGNGSKESPFRLAL